MYTERVRGSDGDGNDVVRAEGNVIAVSVGCEYMDGSHGPGFVFTADDVLEISVVCGVKGVCGVCEMCMGLARDGVGGVEVIG